jgi:hypothetical protein
VRGRSGLIMLLKRRRSFSLVLYEEGSRSVGQLGASRVKQLAFHGSQMILGSIDDIYM